MFVRKLPGIHHFEKLYRAYRMSAREYSPYKIATTPEGYKFVVMPGEGDNDIMHAFGEDPEPMTSKEINKTMAKHRGVFVDVGANIGTFTIPLAFLGYQVIAIEPSPRNLDLLRRSIELNKLQKNVKIYAVGASDKSGYVGMRFVAQNSTKDSILHAKTHYVVRIDRVDDLVKAPIACMKIDTEGEDLRVIRGIQRMLRKNMPALIVVETTNATEKAIVSELKKMRYRQAWIEFPESTHRNLGFVKRR